MLTGRPLERRKAPRTETTGALPGRLVNTETGDEIICKSIDVSRLGLAIESEIQLAVDVRLALEIAGTRVSLTIVSCALPKKGDRMYRYGLFADASGVDLEDVFATAGLITRPISRPGVQGQPDRAPRFLPDQELKLEARTFGTSAPYVLVVENLSRSGLLVGMVNSEHLPFRVNTLLDLVIDPKAKVFEGPIKATGKIVRRVDEKSKDPEKLDVNVVRLGIVIVEVEPRDEAKWVTALEFLERSLA